MSEVQFNHSALTPSSIKLVSDTDDRFNISGNVDDNNIQKILYYLLLNDEDVDNRYQAGQLIRKISPNNESQMVLISSILSENESKVKLQSMETLSKYQSRPELINACKRILLDDRDADMRFEALKILDANKSTDFIPLLKVVSSMDDDPKIQNKAKLLLDELQKPLSIENNEATQ